MMRRFASLVTQDFLVTLRNALVWVVLGTVIFMIATVHFLIPEDFRPEGAWCFYDESENGAIGTVLRQSGVGTPAFLHSREEVEEAVRANRCSLGVIIQGSPRNPVFTVIHRGAIGEESANVINATLEGLVAELADAGRETLHGVEYLRVRARPVPQNLATVPTLLAFELVVLGFLLAAVMVFQEKSDDSIRAYRVTPGGTSFYILAKTLVFVVLAALYGLMLVLFTVGGRAGYASFVLLTVLYTAFYTFLGLTVAAFFNNISQWFPVGLGLLTLNMAPLVFSDAYPGFSPSFVALLPSYGARFGFAEVLFPTGKSLLPLARGLLVQNLVAYALCFLAIDRKLMKEGR